jgi:hypothetical protein
MTTEERLEKMEVQLARVRWFNRCLIACIVLSLGVWFILKTFGPEMVWAQSGVKEIRANRFILEDENGKPRGGLAVEKGSTVLFLLDENGKSRACLAAAKDGPMLSLYDENGKPRAWLAAVMDGSMLSLYDEDGKPRADLTLSSKYGPHLSLTDENGKLIWKAP